MNDWEKVDNKKDDFDFENRGSIQLKRDRKEHSTSTGNLLEEFDNLTTHLDDMIKNQVQGDVKSYNRELTVEEH